MFFLYDIVKMHHVIEPECQVQAIRICHESMTHECAI